MSNTATDAKRYHYAEVLDASGIEVLTFNELYSQEIAKATIYGNHNAQFYHIFRFRGNDNCHYVKNKPIALNIDTLLIINKNILHRYSRRICRGDMVLFSDSFFAANAEKGDFIRGCSLFETDCILMPLLDEAFSKQIDTYFSLLKTAWDTNKSATVTRNWLHNLLITIERKYRSEQGDITEFSALNSPSPVNQFRALLSEHFTTEKQVKFYAEQMNISEQRLSSIIKSKFGISAKEYINETILTAAVTLLENTTLNVGEIALWLGLDFTYFVKFFSRHFGVTPHQYREQKHSDIPD